MACGRGMRHCDGRLIYVVSNLLVCSGKHTWQHFNPLGTEPRNDQIIQLSGGVISSKRVKCSVSMPMKKTQSETRQRRADATKLD